MLVPLTQQFKRILLIKPSALGDVVHAIPVLVKLRARYPDARIDWLITPENADLVRNHPALSSTVLFRRNEFGRFGRSWAATFGPLELLREVRRARYELVVDLHGQVRSAILTLATGAPVRIGFDRPRGWPDMARMDSLRGVHKRHGWNGAREGSWLAYTHRISIPTLDVHAVDRYLWIAPLLGLDHRPPNMQIHLRPKQEQAVDDLLRARALHDGPLAVLVPGTIWETKHWNAEGFAAVGRHLVSSGFTVVIAGTLRDRPRNLLIASMCPGAHDLCGQTMVSGLVALIKRATICVTNDSGSMHVAVAVETPVVSVFGPTNPVWIGPYRRPDAVVRADVSCSPCNLRRLRHCPHDHQCMRQVSAEMVIERINSIQSSRSKLAHSKNLIPGAASKNR
jgi:heptosyltransferase I